MISRLRFSMPLTGQTSKKSFHKAVSPYRLRIKSINQTWQTPPNYLPFSASSLSHSRMSSSTDTRRLLTCARHSMTPPRATCRRGSKLAQGRESTSSRNSTRSWACPRIASTTSVSTYQLRTVICVSVWQQRKHICFPERSFKREKTASSFSETSSLLTDRSIVERPSHLR